MVQETQKAEQIGLFILLGPKCDAFADELPCRILWTAGDGSRKDDQTAPNQTSEL